MRFITWLALLCCAQSALATSILAPTVEQLVDKSDHIGVLKILNAEVVQLKDEDGSYVCSVIYQGEWLDSITGDFGMIQFEGSVGLAIYEPYLVHLASTPRPPLADRANNLMLPPDEIAKVQRRSATCPVLPKLPHVINRVVSLDGSSIASWTASDLWVEPGWIIVSDLQGYNVGRPDPVIDFKTIPKDDFVAKFGYGPLWAIEPKANYIVQWATYCGRIVKAALRSEASSDVATIKTRFCERTY